MVTGPAGAGKTTTGRALAAALGGALLDLDTVTNPMVDIVVAALGADGYDDDRLAPALRDARYACLLGVARDCLRVGSPVVLVAPFTRERDDPAAWTALAEELRRAGGAPRMAWIQISADVLRERLTSRGMARDATKLQDLEHHLGSIDLAPPTVPHIPLNAVDPTAEQVRAALASL